MEEIEYYLDKITESIYFILAGEKSRLIELPSDFPENEVRQVIEYLNRFIKEYNELSDFIFTIANGNLDYEPPEGKTRILHSFKSLQGSLKHLTWKTQQIAKGDFTHKVDFMGDFSLAFNSMVDQLKESFEKIELQKEELFEINNRILESIRYAQRIQNAILPLDSDIREKFPEHFIIYRPRDIVSGDFYWFNKIGNTTIFAVADCTGHGVPGAFLSMLGNTLMNKIIIESAVCDSDVILERLNKDMITLLRQEYSGAFNMAKLYDGMDVCICCLHNNLLNFAGAKRPLFLARKEHDGSTHIIELKGDKNSIGGKQKEKGVTFSRQTIELQKGDTIYLTSDGIFDQPNEAGKMYGAGRFNSFLISNHQYPLQTQKERFQAELDSFTGNANQRDDITVFAVKYNDVDVDSDT